MNILKYDKIQFNLRKNKKQILHEVSGQLYSGEMCVLLGSSGSGKTSLLNILSGRLISNKKYSVKGEIIYNQKKLSNYQNLVGYVTQEDSLSLNITVYESLEFTAHLKLSHLSRHESLNKIEKMISCLNLNNSRSTYFKQLSGGEKKRLAIGVELITEPKIIFLDEPTSGLDSYTALKIVENLNQLKIQNNCIVLMSIHQPSSEIFYLFDRVVLIKSGYGVFNGNLSAVNIYFQQIGYPIPIGHNPADFILLQLQTRTIKQLKTLSNLVDKPNQQSFCDSVVLKPVRQTGFFQQLFYLSQREFRNTIRDRGSLMARFGITILLNLLYALIFLGSGTSSDINTRLGSITQIAISAMFSNSQPILLSFPIERPVFIREYYNGIYNLLPYFFSKLVIQLPLNFIVSTLTMLVLFWIIELQGNIMIYITVIWLLGLVSSSIAMFLGSITKNVKVALETSPIIFVPQIMFAGFFIKIEQIPIFLRWAQYLCSLKFAINLLVITEFHDCRLQPECKYIYDENDIYPNLWYVYFIILLALFIGFRLLSLIFLAKLSRNFI